MTSLWQPLRVGAVVAAGLLLAAIAVAGEPCSDRDPNRQALFGDLHVHTRYSLDASTQGTRTTPDQAYRFARGERLGIQPWSDRGEALRSLQLRRPLDFAMVSDHAELIGEVHMCNTTSASGYSSWQCRLYRGWPRGAYYLFNFFASMRAQHLGLCGDDDKLCKEAARVPWLEMQQAAATHNTPCQFTAFNGYEWTGLEAGSGGNLHRNVVFRDASVPELPPSFIDAPAPDQLWDRLESDCNGGACDALVIPHNSNLSAGHMFPASFEDTPAAAGNALLRRARWEPVIEIMQHKGASECYFEAGVTEDELCAFEQLPEDNIAGFDNPPRPDTGFFRQALLDGLSLHRAQGVNPYNVGVIASTDTHLGTPGAADEDRFLGHGGAGTPAAEEVPAGLPDKLEYNPGGLAVVWAEENTRGAVFDALKRRETYATSGPRIISRFFGGAELDSALCSSADPVAAAYAQGVPMGGTLSGDEASRGISFLAMATQDSGTANGDGVPLQRLQLVKGWLDESGQQRETVVDVAGSADNGAAVDTRSCATSGAGHADLCTVWRDPDFDPAAPAFYYLRVLENPSCRWSQRLCVAAAVDCAVPETIKPGYEVCCSADHRPVIQERAWTSPIWYQP